MCCNSPCNKWRASIDKARHHVHAGKTRPFAYAQHRAAHDGVQANDHAPGLLMAQGVQKEMQQDAGAAMKQATDHAMEDAIKHAMEHAAQPHVPHVPHAGASLCQGQATQPVALHIDQLHVAYEAPGARHTVVKNFSLHVPAGQTACLLGPSGCGKTTVLRAIAGFEPVQGGEIRLGDELLSSPTRHVPPEKRRMGMVFQDHALFPHLSAAQNIAFGLQKMPRAERAARVEHMLRLVGLADMGGRYPHQLSGGQQQRIALARALAPSPRLLLLDEPFSSLDGATSQRLLAEMRAILQQAGQTALLVTHNLHEARALADHVFAMSADGVQRQHLKDACDQGEGCGKVVRELAE